MAHFAVFGAPDPDWEQIHRPSVRGIIQNPDGSLFMIGTVLHGDRCFPGGGVEKGESHVDALVRELKEEAGFITDRASVRFYAQVDLYYPAKKDPGKQMHQINYFYLVRGEKGAQVQLSENESREGVFACDLSAREALAIDRTLLDRPWPWISRAVFILENLLRDGIV